MAQQFIFYSCRGLGCSSHPHGNSQLPVILVRGPNTLFWQLQVPGMHTVHIHRDKTPIHIKKDLILQEKVDRNRGRHLTSISVLACTCRCNVHARVYMHVHTQTHIYIDSEIRERLGVEKTIKTQAEKHMEELVFLHIQHSSPSMSQCHSIAVSL